MAPTAPPKARPSTRNKPAGPVKTHRANALIADGFLFSKADKRLIKHSSFIQRIEKASAPKKSHKRRRPSKKLITTLEAPADALPEVAQGREGRGGGDGGEVGGQVKIKHKSLKSRPGAGKRREKLERAERERFGRNMAQLIGGSGSGSRGVGTGVKTEEEGMQEAKSKLEASAPRERWKALRGFIEGTLDRKEEFMTR